LIARSGFFRIPHWTGRSCSKHGEKQINASDSDEYHVLTRRGERRVFVLIAVFLFPALFVAMVGGYGLLIWLLQMLIGPPGS
jgi:nitrate reductase NapE